MLNVNLYNFFLFNFCIKHTITSEFCFEVSSTFNISHELLRKLCYSSTEMKEEDTDLNLEGSFLQFNCLASGVAFLFMYPIFKSLIATHK